MYVELNNRFKKPIKIYFFLEYCTESGIYYLVVTIARSYQANTDETMLCQHIYATRLLFALI